MNFYFECNFKSSFFRSNFVFYFNFKVKTLALNYLPRKSPSKYCRRFITFHY